MAESCATNGCANEQRLSQLEKNDAGLSSVLTKMDEKMDAMLLKLSRIEVLENSHHYQSEAVGRAHKRLDDLEAKTAAEIKALVNEIGECRKFRHTAEGMAKVAWALWAGLGASVLMLFLKILFFMGSHGVTG